MKRAVRERRKKPKKEEPTKSLLIKGISTELLDKWRMNLQENGLTYKEGFVALLSDQATIPLNHVSANDHCLVAILQKRGILKKKEQIQVLIGAINFIIQQ